MPVTRHFLDWHRPILQSAAQWLAARYATGARLDLDHLVLVLPGRRAGQRLLELLIEYAQHNALGFLPPQVATGGVLPELLYRPGRPLATDALQRLAWNRALRSAPSAVLEKVSARLPEDNASGEWQHLADTMRRLQVDLAAECLTFGDVAQRGFRGATYHERPRWQALHTVYESYLAILSDVGFCDRHAARLGAIANNECTTERDVILIGMAELNRTIAAMLEQIADRVIALVGAPAEYADRFDPFGSILPSAWKDAPIELDDAQILLAQNASHQAEQVVRCLAELDGRFASDQITIGLPDEQLAPQVARQLQQHNLSGRYYVGRRLPETRPYQLLVVLREYVLRGGSQEFAALVRHPDVSGWLLHQGIADDWIVQLDSYLARHLPAQFSNRWLGRTDEHGQIEQAYSLVGDLIGAPPDDARQPLATWCESIRQVLSEIYAADRPSVDAASERITLEACTQLAGALDVLATLPERVAPQVTLAEAIELILSQLVGEFVPAEPDPTAIEMLGWLELPLDDAPSLVVTTFNERFVPKSVCGDLFLPDALRRQLQIDDNLRRYARDAYALDVLIHTREFLRLIVSRSDTRQNTLAPSRLLFATDGATIARRVLRLYEPGPGATRRPVGGRFISTRERSDFAIPRPDDPAHAAFRDPRSNLDTLRVSDFKSYLACPYRFYLQRVLRLEPLDDRVVELDALKFGELVHDVLQAFGTSEVKNSQDAEQISEFFEHQLQLAVGTKYGSLRRPAVNVQIGQIRQRLRALARWQARWSAQGWEIKMVEAAPKEGAPWSVDDQPLKLSGRIDRIDQHADGRYMIFDYKTSAQCKSPDKTHRENDQWVDLQLPLYRHIVRSLGITGDVGLGYIVLPEDTKKTGHLLAEWTPAELRDADEAAREVVRRIRRGEFWPPREIPPHYNDDYAAICMTGVFERPALDEALHRG